MNIYEKLYNIQQAMKNPKNNFNKFGNFNYRSAEDILAECKPFLKDNRCTLIHQNDVVIIGNDTYIKAIVELKDIDDITQTIKTVAYAREAREKKGMDTAQITGSTISYALKYALNGLFAICTEKDLDHESFYENKEKNNLQQKQEKRATKEQREYVLKAVKNGVCTTDDIEQKIKEFAPNNKLFNKLTYNQAQQIVNWVKNKI